jgi:hypothetical protein
VVLAHQQEGCTMKMRPKNTRSTLVEVALAASLLAGGAAIAPVAASPVDAAVPVPAAGPHGCDPGHFCTYFNRDYTVMVDNMTSCTWHKSNGYFSSYVNNLRPLGKRASFYDVDRNWTTSTKPSPDKGTTSFGDGRSYYIRPC